MTQQVTNESCFMECLGLSDPSKKHKVRQIMTSIGGLDIMCLHEVKITRLLLCVALYIIWSRAKCFYFDRHDEKASVATLNFPQLTSPIVGQGIDPIQRLGWTLKS